MKNAAKENEKEWSHPGGKLRREGPDSCSEGELLAIILGSGTRDRSALQIANEILDHYHSLVGLKGRTLSELMQIKGLKGVKATRLAASFEIAKRLQRYSERGW